MGHEKRLHTVQEIGGVMNKKTARLWGEIYRVSGIMLAIEEMEPVDRLPFLAVIRENVDKLTDIIIATPEPKKSIKKQKKIYK